MRTPLVAGNWKMNLTPAAAIELAAGIRDGSAEISNTEILLCPPSLYIRQVCEAVSGSSIKVGGQTLYWETEGAFTGEISGMMLNELGCAYCIVGHSERRHVFGETDEDVNRKALAALSHGLIPILCVGEIQEERETGSTEEVISRHVNRGLEGFSSVDGQKLVVAYEPVWAIGTGLTATPEMAGEVHSLIRGLLTEHFGDEIARGIRILYGGSVKPENIDGLATESEIDGALVGGASLEADSFLDIIRGCERQANS